MWAKKMWEKQWLIHMCDMSHKCLAVHAMVQGGDDEQDALKLQVSFCKTAMNYRALLRTMSQMRYHDMH